jgi:hypothetical protein
MNYPMAVILLLISLLLATAPSGTALADPTLPQDFDRDACYSNCPCSIQGMELDCADCKQKCDEQYWKEFGEETQSGQVGSNSSK